MLIALPMVLLAAASVCSVPQLVLQSLMQLAAVCAAGRIHPNDQKIVRHPPQTLLPLLQLLLVESHVFAMNLRDAWSS